MATWNEALDLGWKFQQSGDPERAQAIYREILRDNPCNARVWFVLGTVCQAQRQQEEAVRCFEQALRLEPQEAEGYFYLGNALLEQGKLGQAARS